MAWAFSVLIHIAEQLSSRAVAVDTLPPTVHTGAWSPCPHCIRAVRPFWKVEMSLHDLSLVFFGLPVKLSSLSHVISHFLVLCELLVCVSFAYFLWRSLSFSYGLTSSFL